MTSDVDDANALDLVTPARAGGAPVVVLRLSLLYTPLTVPPYLLCLSLSL